MVDDGVFCFVSEQYFFLLSKGFDYGASMRQFCVSTIGFGHRKSPTSVAIRGEVFHSGLVSESRRMFGLS